MLCIRCCSLFQPQVYTHPFPYVLALIPAALMPCFSIRLAGIYSDDARDGGVWELAQAVRWAVLGQVFAEGTDGCDGTWSSCTSGFKGFGFYGGKAHIVLKYLLEKYAVVRWPEAGDIC